MNDDMIYMDLALKEAKKSLKFDDVPIGAIVVKNNRIISKAHNMKERLSISTRHAEMIAIEKACKKLNSWYLSDCTLYVTVEPCLMCCGAIIQSRIKRVVYATKNEKFGYVESIEKIFQNKKNNHSVLVEKGVYEKEAKELIQKFFQKKRNN
ncbi:MAG: nucleoside deaminase [Bacilli bacterium]|nr:nucleoside deaminase [Bacilli bacterium]